MTPPDPARYAMTAAAAIGAEFEDLDKGRGYLYRVTLGGRSVLGGGGGVCAYPVNSAAAFTIARDKAHTKSVLRAANIPVIPGGLFFSHRRRAAMRDPGRDVEDALTFANTLGYPVFCKPNQGGRGNFAEIVTSPDELAVYTQRIAVEFESFLVEPVLTGVEHRILVFDGAPLAHIAKRPPILIGDGVRTWRELLAAANAQLAGDGVSDAPLSAITAAGAAPDTVPPAGERLTLAGRQNLHAAGEAETVSDKSPSSLAQIAVSATQAIGLRVGAVDIFDTSPARDLSDLVVIEVNGNPGLAAIERAGRSDIIQALWTAMFKDCLEA